MMAGTALRDTTPLIVIYPAKDDGNITQAYPVESDIITYIDRVLPLHADRIR